MTRIRTNPVCSIARTSVACFVLSAASFSGAFMVDATAADGADRLILRNLDIIADRTVAAFDEDGVQLDDKRVITWDEIERATVDASKQEAFDKLLKELGSPLYRIRQRLKVGDYEGLLEPAEAIYSRYVGRTSETAYMVFQSLMWARIAVGNREAAVETYLHCYDYLRATRSRGKLPGERRLEFDPATALSPTLSPVWFDAEAAKAALPGVFDAIKAMQQPRPEGVYIYYGTLAAAAGDTTTAQQMIDAARGSDQAITEWRDIGLAQLEITQDAAGSAVSRLESTLDKLLPQNRPPALYWLALAKLKSTDERTRQEGVLRLLHLPAVYGKTNPELAGAGLFQAMRALEQLGDVKGSVAVRNELLVRYAHTVHAAKVKAESGIHRNE